MVGFQFINTRLLGAPIPGHQHFEEINLRFYVRRETAGELRRGVVFVREIVPRRAIAWVARWVYGEPYLALPTRSDFSPPTPGERPAAVGYSGDTGAIGCLFRPSRGDALEPRAAEGSEEEFITEHYWGYTRHSEVAASEYQVEHPRWKALERRQPATRGRPSRLYGDAFAGYLRGTPSSAFVADGSAVTVRRGTKITTPDSPLKQPRNPTSAMTRILAALLLLAPTAHAAEVKLLSWNLESDGVDSEIVARQIVELGEHDLYCFQEVTGRDFGRTPSRSATPSAATGSSPRTQAATTG